MKITKFVLIIILLLGSKGLEMKGQDVQFGLYADPVISWFGSNTNETINEGVAAGFSFGITFHKYFADNYAFSTGLNLVNAGGRVSHPVATELYFSNINPIVEAGEKISYKINYLAIPIGIYMKTNQIGYVTVFSDIGLDPKVVIGAKADIPSIDISGENAVDEINLFNMSYHIMGGIEYSLGGTTSLIFGVGFDNNFLDITTDKNAQPEDKIKHRLVKIKLGINF